MTTFELLKLGILRLLKASDGSMDDPNDPRHWEWWATLDEEYYSYVQYFTNWIRKSSIPITISNI